jgi:hypothetical protein
MCIARSCVLMLIVGRRLRECMNTTSIVGKDLCKGTVFGKALENFKDFVLIQPRRLDSAQLLQIHAGWTFKEEYRKGMMPVEESESTRQLDEDVQDCRLEDG